MRRNVHFVYQKLYAKRTLTTRQVRQLQLYIFEAECLHEMAVGMLSGSDCGHVANSYAEYLKQQPPLFHEDDWLEGDSK